jgi:hypothetical protein
MKASWSTTQNVEAMVGLALVDARDFGFGWRLYPERTLAESIALLNKALAIDPSFSHGYYAKGVALLSCQRSGVIVRDGLSASPAWTAACASLTRSRCARAAGGQSFIAADCEGLTAEPVRSLIGPSKEFLLNLHRDLIQPFFDAVSPILLIPGLSFKFPYLVFGCAEQTPCEFVSTACRYFASAAPAARSRALKIVCPALSSGSPDSALAVRFGCKGNYCLCHGCTAIGTPVSKTLRRIFSTQSALRQFGPLWITLFCCRCALRATLPNSLLPLAIPSESRCPSLRHSS